MMSSYWIFEVFDVVLFSIKFLTIFLHFWWI